MVWSVREGPNRPDYAPESSMFTIQYNHGGYFSWERPIRYVDGVVDFIDYCEPSEMSHLRILAMAGNFGHLDVKKIYYKRVGYDFDSDIRVLKYDVDAKGLGKLVDKNRVIEIYCESHNENDVELGSDSEVEVQNYNDVASCDEHSQFGTDDDIGKADETPFNNENFNVDRGTGPSVYTSSVHEDDVMNEGYCPSDGFESLNDSDGSDGGATMKKFPQFGNSDMTKVKFTVGLTFPTHDQLTSAITEYALQFGKNLSLPKNSKDRVQVECKAKVNGCPFYMWCSRLPNQAKFQVKTLIDKHTCVRTNLNNHCTPKYIAKRYLEKIRTTRKFDVVDFQRDVGKDLECKVSIRQCYKAYQIAKRWMEGKSGDQYELLWDYAHELKRTNLGTTVKLAFSSKKGPNKENVFKAIYICWGALKRGFLEGCRPLIGLDGCHLSGPHKGVLVTAVAIDPNNCMYPFAYAVVGSETYESWRWFIRLLSIDLDIDDATKYTIMSDKQKGLIRAVDELLPGVEHRFCVRHLWCNFKQEHKGQALKDMLWRAARSTTKAHFKIAMDQMNALDPQAHDWLALRTADHWSRSHFAVHCKSDLLLNNLCESFNACIREARGKPILTMLEEIRRYLMDLVMRKLESTNKKTDIICPKIQEKLELVKLRSHEWLPKHNGKEGYEVSGPHSQYTVSLISRTCSCRVWQLSGLPCVHAICAIYYHQDNVEDYVHQCYLRTTYMRVYSQVMMPINGREMWKKCKKGTILPPPVVRVAGRPKKARNRDPLEASEAKESSEAKEARKTNEKMSLSRKGRTMNCGKCGVAGHNSRSCGKEKPVKKSKSKGVRQVKVKESTLIDESDIEHEFDVEIENDNMNGRDGEHMVDVHVQVEPVERALFLGVPVELVETIVEESVHIPVETMPMKEGEQINNQDMFKIGVFTDEEILEMMSTHSMKSATNEVETSQKKDRKRKSSTQPPKKQVRKSSRLALNPRSGPKLVTEIDLTKEENDSGPSKLHAGIMNPRQPVYQGYLPKGSFIKGDKIYTSATALAAEVEWKKQQAKYNNI